MDTIYAGKAPEVGYELDTYITNQKDLKKYLKLLEDNKLEYQLEKKPLRELLDEIDEIDEIRNIGIAAGSMSGETSWAYPEED